MIAGLDSAQPPTAAQVAAARAAGVGLWSGYLATRPNVGLLRPWTQAEFDVARAAGGTPIAFCSGWDDPAGCRALGAAWNVRPCLDVEDGIRPDGPWVPPWLDASGAGLYGQANVHIGRSAPFHVLADYPGYDPGLTWPNFTGLIVPRPPTAAGWQWWGSHQEFGLDVDRGWYDDWFGGEMTPEQAAQLQAIYDALINYGGSGQSALFTGGPASIGSMVGEMHAALAGQAGPLPDSWLAQQLQAIQMALTLLQVGGLTAEQAQQLAAIQAATARIETGLKGA